MACTTDMVRLGMATYVINAHILAALIKMQMTTYVSALQRALAIPDMQVSPDSVELYGSCTLKLAVSSDRFAGNPGIQIPGLAVSSDATQLDSGILGQDHHDIPAGFQDIVILLLCPRGCGGALTRQMYVTHGISLQGEVLAGAYLDSNRGANFIRAFFHHFPP